MKLFTRTALALAISACTLPAYAAVVLEEVIVTAQKRAQDLQDTPIAVSVFNAEDLEHQGISDIEDLSQYAPNVQIAESPGGSNSATIGIRGSVSINPAVTWEPTVGIYMDGVFIAKNAGGLFDVAELERVEVLRGPQGSLYGKNTVGGAINLVTKQPAEKMGGSIKIGGGNYGAQTLGFTANSGTVGDMARFSLAYAEKERDGLYSNSVAGAASEFKRIDTESGRFAAAFDLSDKVELLYTYDWSKKDNTPSFGQLDLPTDPVKRKSSGTLNGSIEDTSEVKGHAITLTWEVSENMTFKSITSQREMQFKDTGDYDGTADTGFHAIRDIDHKQISQEFQLIGQQGSVDYVAGLFYFKEKADAFNPLTAFDFMSTFMPLTTENTYGVKAESMAAYTQLDWHTTDKLTLTLGARITEETKDAYSEHPTEVMFFNPQIPYTTASNTWENFSPSFVASYAWNDDTTSYFKVAEGWKAGGFNGEGATAIELTTPYSEETVTSYELGVKSRLLEDRVQINAAVFQNDLQDMQISEYTFMYSSIKNANATIKGFEVELVAALAEGLTVNANYGYLDAQYDGYAVADARFPYSPDNTYSVGVEYEQDLSVGHLTARMDYSHVDDHDLYDDPSSAAVTHVEAYDLLNARLTLSELQVASGQNLKLSLWGKNLTDEDYRINGIPAQVGAVNYYGDPRSYGVDVTYDF